MSDITVQDVSASKLPVIGKAHTGFRVTIEPGTKRIMATFNGETIADSARVLIMHETRLANVYYFPREDVRMEFLQRDTPLHQLSVQGQCQPLVGHGRRQNG